MTLVTWLTVEHSEPGDNATAQRAATIFAQTGKLAEDMLWKTA